MAIYKEVLEENYTVVGSPTITDEYIGSNWSSSNYLTLPVTLDSTDNTWEVFTNFKTTSSSNYQYPFGVTKGNDAIIIGVDDGKIVMYLSSGSGWDIASAQGTYSISLNTLYYVKLQFTGTNYILSVSTDKENWTVSANVSSSTKISSGKTLYLGSSWSMSENYLRGEIDLKDCYIKKNGSIAWEAVTEELVDVSGSVEISKGYYSDGSNKINMPASTYNIDALTANQTLGGKNKLFAYTDSTDSVGALITSTTPTGSFKITKDLEHPVYLDPTKNYIAGGELIEPEVSFVGTDVSSTKALQYQEAQDTTYWIPSEATVSLDSVKAVQSVGPVNDLYLTSLTSNPTASLSFSDNGEIGGVHNKLPLKPKVYLNNETDEILGVQERPDEIVISRNATENYTVTGSPTITDDYVASDFSDSNYLTCSTALPSSISSFYIVTKAKVDSFDGHAVLFANTSQEKYFGVRAASQTFSMYDSSWTEGTTVIPLDTWYWFMVTYDGTNLKGYVLRDTGYSLNTLPSVDGWSHEWTKVSSWIQGVTFNIGTNTFFAGEYIRGEIDLKSIKYVADGVEWKAVAIQDGITASGWSHYGPTKTFQFMPGVSFKSVAVTPAESYTVADMLQSYPLQGQSPYPLYYTNTTDYSGIALFGSYQAGYTWYTGYKVTFTDTTNTTIASIEKSGTRCRLYCATTGTDTSSYGQELTYYAVTIPQFEAGLISGTQIKKEAIINQNLGRIPLTFTGTVTVGTEVVYSSTEDTITEGSTTATFVGEFIVEA